MTVAYRLNRQRHRDSIWSGRGAAVAGGRWNGRGSRVVYASDSVALCQLEVLANSTSLENLVGYDLATATFPDNYVIAIEDVYELPLGWMRYPHPVKTSAIGDHWVETAVSPVLSVPSVLSPKERNYLLNPAHAEFELIDFSEPEPHEFDRRLGSRAQSFLSTAMKAS